MDELKKDEHQSNETHTEGKSPEPEDTVEQKPDDVELTDDATPTV
jgi:hypothetical protein